MEQGYQAEGRTENRLQSALAIPIAQRSGMAAVWTLYRQHPDAFSPVDLASLAHRLKPEN